MVNNIFSKLKATLTKLTDLSAEDFTQLFSWPSCGSLQADNPNLLVAKSTNENGDVVAYVAAEPLLLVNGYVFNPKNTPSVVKKAGEEIDATLAEQAGVDRVWVVIPDEAPHIEGEKILRVVERRFSQPVNPKQKLQSMNSSSAFIN